MKPLLFLLLIIGGAPVFGQSAKKLNTQLRAELLVHQQKQDSSEKVFLEEAEILEQVRKDIRNKTKTVLYPEDKKMRKTAVSITGLINTLKYLEVNTADVYPDGADFDSYPDYKLAIKPVSEARDRFVEFGRVESDELNLDEYNRKEQNEQLKLWIQKYETSAKSNQIKIQIQRDYIEKITSFYPRMDSLFLVYQSVNRELETKNDLLLKKLEFARENYRLKGPKGFSKAYQDQFPEIHPAKETISGDFGFVTIDKTGGSDNAGSITDEGSSDIPMIVGPKTVETVQEPEIFEVTDEPASFPGGMEALKKYLAENIKYPQTAKDQGISGKAYLKFIVSDKGAISNVKILRGVPDCPECDAEAIRVIKTMPKWIPGRINGKVVNSYFILPIQFKL